MTIITPTEEAASILIRVFESLARLNHKTLAPSTRSDLVRACELLSQAAGDLDVLDDLDDPAPTRQERGQVDDERFQRWRTIRRAEAEEERAG